MPKVDLARVVSESARRLAPAGQIWHVAVALSGGLDSAVLLHALARTREALAMTLRAFHVNHGISAHADEWERHCGRLAGSLDIRFDSMRIDVARPYASGLEAHARTLRYAALRQMADRWGVATLALAHHADDQAETVLLQLLRGGAPRGLAAMPEMRHGIPSQHDPSGSPATGPALWRPLLGVCRRDIEAYARQAGLDWIEDESNHDVRLRRNFVRSRVMPLLAEGFPHYRAHLARAAAIAADTSILTDSLARLDATIVMSPGGIDVAELRTLGSARAANVVRYVLEGRRISVPPHERLTEFVRQALTESTRTRPSLDLGDGLWLLRECGTIDIVVVPGDWRANWHREPAVDLPHGRLTFEPTMGIGIAALLVPPEGIAIVSRGGGERLRLAANRPRRTLKNLMQEAGIRATLRKDWPILISGDEVVAIPGVGVGVDWQCPPGAPGWSVAWQPRTPLSA